MLVRLAASRMTPRVEAEHNCHPDGVLQTAEYRALRSLWEEHKQKVQCEQK